MVDLSVIVIGRNEAEQIEGCLRSVFASLEGFQDYEVIYVDSASEDNTVEIASRFPIRVLQLQPGWKLTPSAGRFVGYHHAVGRFLLFVDGDSTMYRRWLPVAYRFLDGNPQYGGVAGVANRSYPNTSGTATAIESNYYDQPLDKPMHDVAFLAGSALYRREAMERAGTFNPYLPTGEECEIGLRIGRAGYRMARLNEPMYVKHTLPPDSVGEIMRRARSRLYDYGIPLRYSLTAGNGLRFSIEQMWFVFTFMGALAAALAVVAVGLAAGAKWPLVAVAIGAVALLAWKRKHPRSLAISFLKRTMMTYHTIKSFITTTTLPSDSYPTDAAVVK